MRKSDFWYDLPEKLIAQTPIEPRDTSRMLTLDRKTGVIGHRHFYDILDLLNKGDTLILNNSRVLPARLYGKRTDTGGDIEFLLLEQKQQDIWEILVKPGKRARIGSKFVFGDGLLNAEVLDILPADGNRLVRFKWQCGSFFNVLEQIGQMPLPPYIKQKLQDKERYQTVYSKEPGSAAAPTAGLHFTPELLERIKSKGINIGFVTLHVGLGTFRPVKEDNITDHKMHSEHYYLPQETADLINKTKANGKRVIAVGTTSCRTLEAAVATYGCVQACEGYTDIFIYPGFEFKVLDGIITNFHLPESTLIMLVSAFAGYEHTMNAYKIAVEEQYRFFSFGDAMFIV
ncbi:tRNA preQ1(34) S-adenosylmethionine ribosyltransferase-isomerase QueA [Acetanaerobacterium elongatum]|uniref:S-adenosylmethionine:tRNA ribosyltransferase-isomerase n=1 Tax=Acetanaerobacterium elongatum TaxID=258515 RepID=A0A1H0BD05_9FIRM|nr:tRNA preQ1(34) S-adenosylmethionine ribosyltransferase-isomerase QueA [Acetanaerobacterium elongatum]SDN43471.1 S-adenosylmethionine--tRNA ribosyltransferase-isomerase [Acetanaerobacterium elongatum]